MSPAVLPGLLTAMCWQALSLADGRTGLVVVGEVGGGTRQEQLALGETPRIGRTKGIFALPRRQRVPLDLPSAPYRRIRRARRMHRRSLSWKSLLIMPFLCSLTSVANCWYMARMLQQDG
jgi:hypothetical protein